MKKLVLMAIAALICGAVFTDCSADGAQSTEEKVAEQSPEAQTHSATEEDIKTEEINVTLKNSDSYQKDLAAGGDEEGAIIKVQATHYEKSELIRNESTNFSVIYHYKPATDFIGEDEVVIEVINNKTGLDPIIKNVKITFTVTEGDNTTGISEPEDGNENHVNITGLWKLMAVSYWDEEPLRLDYVQNDIIYDFRVNNVLSVTGKIDGIDDYRGHSIGDHTYTILPIPPSEPPMCTFGLPTEIDAEPYTLSFGWVFFDSYEGSAMHINTPHGTLTLVYVENLSNCERCNTSKCGPDVIINKTEYENAPDYQVVIEEMKMEGNCLKIRFSASGCDGNSWVVKLIDSESIEKSLPIQRTLRLSLDNQEVCEAWITKEVFFNIEGLQIHDYTDKSVYLKVSGKGILYKY